MLALEAELRRRHAGIHPDVPPHAPREDTVLFPKLREIVSRHAFDAIGEEMEKREHQHFGEDGFEKAVAQVAELEKKVGLYDLTQFTPKALQSASHVVPGSDGRRIRSGFSLRSKERSRAQTARLDAPAKRGRLIVRMQSRGGSQIWSSMHYRTKPTR